MSIDEAKIINQSINRMLARREHSRHEIIQKLKEKEFAPALCYQQLQLFINRNLQSDTRYAESYVRSCYLKGKGPNVIRQQLKQHDIESSECNDILKSDDYDWFDAACRVREKKYGRDLPKDFADKQKQMRFLQYRGFEQAHIQVAFE